MGGHQMSLLATVTLTWAVIYGYVASYSFTLHGYRPGERELRPFALATLGMMIYAVGSTVLADAGTTAGANVAFQISMVGGALATAGFFHFAHALANRPIGRAVAAGYALACVSVILNLSGLMFDMTIPATPHPMLVQGRHTFLLPEPTLAYVMIAGVSLVAIVGGAWIMRTRIPTTDSSERLWLSGTGAVLAVGALHDALINFFPIRSVYLLEHCYLLFALAMTHHLLGRVARTDAELGRRTQQLKDSLVDLQRTEAELAHKEQLAAVGELSAIIAQEVRNPIALIGNALTRLHQPLAADSDRHTMLDVVDQESDRLNHLVGDLLSYAKPLHAQIARTPISHVIERALSTIPTTVREHTVVETHIAAEPSALECDPELLHQALRNLIDNALAPLVGARTVTIETSACEHRGAAALRVSITSKRNTVPTDQADTIHSGSVRPTGTGLGLAIVDRVVRAHQGHVEMRSVTAGASTIILTLPLRTEGTEPVTTSLLPGPLSTATLQRA